jgi:hypothetical protein
MLGLERQVTGPAGALARFDTRPRRREIIVQMVGD